MKFTNTEVEDFIESIMTIIDHYRGGFEDPDRTIDIIEELCNDFKNNYICPYEKHTAEWYDEHGE